MAFDLFLVNSYLAYKQRLLPPFFEPLEGEEQALLEEERDRLERVGYRLLHLPD